MSLPHNQPPAHDKDLFHCHNSKNNSSNEARFFNLDRALMHAYPSTQSVQGLPVEHDGDPRHLQTFSSLWQAGFPSPILAIHEKYRRLAVFSISGVIAKSTSAFTRFIERQKK